jgi:hypothetical protein
MAFRLSRLFPFLRFLEPLFEDDPVDELKLFGHVRITTRPRLGGPETVVYDDKNFIVDLGKTTVRDLLLGSSGGGISGSIFRMAVGDGGTPPAELFNPKPPDGTWPARTGLFHEIIRQDISVFTKPTATSARFEGSFNSIDTDPTSFSLAEGVVNEASLIIGDGVLTVGGAKKQIHKTPPDTVDADEKVMSVRTFKSTPFDPLSDVTVTITWTINVVT